MKIPVMLKYYDDENQPHSVKAKVSPPDLSNEKFLSTVEVEDPKYFKAIMDAFLITGTPDYPITVSRGEVEVEVGLELEFENMFIKKSDYKKLQSA